MRKIWTYGGYFESFMATLTKEQRRKIQYGLLLLKTMDRLPTKFVKSMGEGLFELRTEYEGNTFRTFFIFERDDVIVLFNGFQKKSRKTPRTELLIARQLMKEYYGRAH